MCLFLFTSKVYIIEPSQPIIVLHQLFHLISFMLSSIHLWYQSNELLIKDIIRRHASSECEFFLLNFEFIPGISTISSILPIKCVHSSNFQHLKTWPFRIVLHTLEPHYNTTGDHVIIRKAVYDHHSTESSFIDLKNRMSLLFFESLYHSTRFLCLFFVSHLVIICLFYISKQLRRFSDECNYVFTPISSIILFR